MDRDGTKNGFDLEFVKKATSKILNIPVIASGGVGKLEHFKEGVIKLVVQVLLLAASVFHFAEFSIKDVKIFLNKNNIQVRL